jgi:predicted phosphodiesterase
MNLMFIGDVHACWHRLYDGISRITRVHDVRAAIQVGDFGFFSRFSASHFGRNGSFHLPIPMYVIDGNHEDHAWLRSQVDRGLCSRWERESNLFFQPRGSIRRIGGVTIGFCGGALHVDRPQEGSLDQMTTNWVSDHEAERAAETFSEHQVDLIVTHSCPHSIGVGMRGRPYLAADAERHITRCGFSAGPMSDCGEPGLLHLWRHLRHFPREWVFGHFHAHHHAEIQGVRFRCVGSIDGSDDRTEPVMYILNTENWAWRALKW